MNKKSILKFIVTSLATLIIGFLVGFLLLGSYLTKDLEFYLVGGTTKIGIGNTYKEKGFICNIKGEDYSKEVLTTYYNDANEVVTNISTDKISTYYIEYKIETSKITASLIRVVNVVEMEDLEINFIMLGNSSTGDSIYIKAGETDILVDAGSLQSSAKSIKDYITDSNSDLHSYVEDNKLEYVIATHADKDHIAAFVGTKEEKGILKDNELDIETIIEFPRTDKTSSIYNEYRKAVNELKANGTNVYTALDCYNNQNGASRIIEVAVGIEIEILYNYFYDHESKDENNYSVCFMLRRGEEQYLFTGDLEEKGEEYLVKNNDLGEVYFFKLGHHGSPTSSTRELLDIIKPKVVVATCVAFSGQYSDNNDNTFPGTAVVDRLIDLKTVEHFYVPYMISDNEEGYEPANGHIVVKANSSGTYVECSETNEDFFNFEIFKKYRRWSTN